MIKYMSLLIFVFSTLSATAEVSDPEYLDSEIENLMYTLGQVGSLQVDRYAAYNGATDWTIDVQSFELEGDTNDEVDAAYEALIEEENEALKQKLLKNISDKGEAIDEKLESMGLQELLRYFRTDNSVKAFTQEGANDAQILMWFQNEILTFAAKLYLEGVVFSSDKYLEYYRSHMSDVGAEIIGEDVIIIRGVKKVIVIRIDYTHS